MSGFVMHVHTYELQLSKIGEIDSKICSLKREWYEKVRNH